MKDFVLFLMPWGASEPGKTFGGNRGADGRDPGVQVSVAEGGRLLGVRRPETPAFPPVTQEKGRACGLGLPVLLTHWLTCVSSSVTPWTERVLPTLTFLVLGPAYIRALVHSYESVIELVP